MVIRDGEDTDAYDVLNIYQSNNNVLIGINGSLEIPVYINNVNGNRNVLLAIWGRAAGDSATEMVHGVSGHQHGSFQNKYDNDQVAFASNGLVVGNDSGSWSTSNTRVTGTEGTSTTIGRVGYQTPYAYTAVPQAVQIWIDGTEYTATIGDENSKGATMYDSTNDDWGVDGATEWDTGWLTLSSVISWTAGWHTIKIVETGGTGGVLIYHLSVNAGGDQT